MRVEDPCLINTSQHAPEPSSDVTNRKVAGRTCNRIKIAFRLLKQGKRYPFAVISYGISESVCFFHTVSQLADLIQHAVLAYLISTDTQNTVYTKESGIGYLLQFCMVMAYRIGEI